MFWLSSFLNLSKIEINADFIILETVHYNLHEITKDVLRFEQNWDKKNQTNLFLSLKKDLVKFYWAIRLKLAGLAQNMINQSDLSALLQADALFFLSVPGSEHSFQDLQRTWV